MRRQLTVRDLLALSASLATIALATVVLRVTPDVSPTTVALTLLLVVLATATAARRATPVRNAATSARARTRTETPVRQSRGRI
jgi:hypothetical protein